MTLNITPRDILVRWVGDNKPFTEEDETFVELFGDALEIIMDKVPDLETLVSAGRVSLSSVKQVMVAMLTRFYSVSQEYRSSFSETVGSFSHSGSYSNAGENAGVMRLTHDELLLLKGIDKDSKVGSVAWGHSYRSNIHCEDGWELTDIIPARKIAGVEPND